MSRVCFPCQFSSKSRYTCPTCKQELTQLDSRWRVPKKDDKKGWQSLKRLTTPARKMNHDICLGMKKSKRSRKKGGSGERRLNQEYKKTLPRQALTLLVS